MVIVHNIILVSCDINLEKKSILCQLHEQTFSIQICNKNQMIKDISDTLIISQLCEKKFFRQMYYKIQKIRIMLNNLVLSVISINSSVTLSHIQWKKTQPYSIICKYLTTIHDKKHCVLFIYDNWKRKIISSLYLGNNIQSAVACVRSSDYDKYRENKTNSIVPLTCV